MWPKLMEEHNGPLCFLLGNNKRCLTQKNTIVVAARGGRAHARLGKEGSTKPFGCSQFMNGGLCKSKLF